MADTGTQLYAWTSGGSEDEWDSVSALGSTVSHRREREPALHFRTPAEPQSTSASLPSEGGAQELSASPRVFETSPPLHSFLPSAKSGLAASTGLFLFASGSVRLTPMVTCGLLPSLGVPTKRDREAQVPGGWKHSGACRFGVSFINIDPSSNMGSQALCLLSPLLGSHRGQVPHSDGWDGRQPQGVSLRPVVSPTLTPTLTHEHQPTVFYGWETAWLDGLCKETQGAGGYLLRLKYMHSDAKMCLFRFLLFFFFF